MGVNVGQMRGIREVAVEEAVQKDDLNFRREEEWDDVQTYLFLSGGRRVGDGGVHNQRLFFLFHFT